MSRRGQAPTKLVKIGNWYRIRLRVDNPDGTRTQKSIKVCPIKGPGALTEAERKSKRIEILSKYSVEANRQSAIENVDLLTFGEQAVIFLQEMAHRRRKPIAPSTLSTWKSNLGNHVLPLLKDYPLGRVGNVELKKIVDSLAKDGYSADAIRTVCLVVRLVRASAIDKKSGEELYAYKWNMNFVDAPVVDRNRQKTPAFSADEATKVITHAKGWLQTLLILAFATGARFGELLALECRHFDGSSIRVEQSLWDRTIGLTKTAHSNRSIELHPDVADWLTRFLNGRKRGFIFQNKKGKPLAQSNILRRHLNPLLIKLEIKRPHLALHGARRFRQTFLRNKTNCTEGVYKFWMGHSDGSMSDHYDKIGSEKERAFRQDVAKSCGYGFTLPSSTVPNVPTTDHEGVCVNQ